MKKILLLVLPLVCVTFLMASHLTPLELGNGLDLTYGGEFRTRAIMNNDLNENNGGWFDNRLRFDLAAKLGDKIGIVWTPEVGDIVWADYGTKNVPIETRELYLDYQMNWMETKVRLGQQYWYDHRSLVLDDYFSGITSDLSIAGIPSELGFIKGYEGVPNKLDDAHVAFANFVFKAPVDWGLTAMFGQKHYDNNPELDITDGKTADIWIIPYFMLNFEPVTLDLTAVINQQMYNKDIYPEESEMGMAFAAKLGIDAGVKLGADVLYVSDKGIHTLSSYYVNGLYLFGNQLPFDGVQICSDYTGWTDDTGKGVAYMSIVGTASYPFSEKLEVYGAVGMAQAKDPIGTELNVGMNYKVVDHLTFNPVLAIGQTGKALEPDFGGEEQTNMVYMLGGLLKAEF
jgi:predicted porin